jgi:hypothetical protein
MQPGPASASNVLTFKMLLSVVHSEYSLAFKRKLFKTCRACGNAFGVVLKVVQLMVEMFVQSELVVNKFVLFYMPITG